MSYTCPSFFCFGITTTQALTFVNLYIFPKNLRFVCETQHFQLNTLKKRLCTLCVPIDILISVQKCAIAFSVSLKISQFISIVCNIVTP